MPIKKYRKPGTRIDDAVALQQRVADGQATPDEVQKYQRVINELTSKYRAGTLAPATARRFGIE
jgi:hypothetical protein